MLLLLPDNVHGYLVEVLCSNSDELLIMNCCTALPVDDESVSNVELLEVFRSIIIATAATATMNTTTIQTTVLIFRLSMREVRVMDNTRGERGMLTQL